MTYREYTFEQYVAVQRAPEVNLFTNPAAYVNLFDAGVDINGGSLARRDFGLIAAPRDTAFRVTGTGSSSDTYMFLGGPQGAVRNGMEAGKTYQVRGTIEIPAVLTGTANTRARRIVLFTKVGAAAYVETMSAQAPNTVGAHDLSLTFTVPAGVTEAFLRFYHGHPSTQVVDWHSLMLVEAPAGYVSTGYWDGDSYVLNRNADEREAGWDGTPHASTSWMVDRAQNLVLDDAELEFTMDMYAVPFISGRVTAPAPSADVLEELLDPRRPRDVILNVWVRRFTRYTPGSAFAQATEFPSGSTGDAVAKFWLRTVEIDEITGEMVMSFASGEVRPDDKIRVSTSVINTGATTVAALVEYALTDAGEAAAIDDLSAAASTAVPAGDRREQAPGASNASIYESELAAIGLRLFADEYGKFVVSAFDDPPGVVSGVINATDGDLNVSGRIMEARRRLSRLDEWADGVIVKADYENSAGTRVVAFQRHHTNGTSSRKGMLHTLQRAIPSGYAESIAGRAATRGETYRFRMVDDFLFRPGRTLRFYRASGEITDHVMTRVTHRPGQGEMDVDAYTIGEYVP
jgi:hypothetical protein